VCGSTDHPRPAQASTQTVTPDDERRAEQRHREAEAARASADDALRELETRLAAAEAAAGGLDVPAAAQIEIDLQHRRDTALAAHDDLGRMTARLEAVVQQRNQAADISAQIATDLTALQSRRTEVSRRRSRLRDALATELGAQNTVDDGLHTMTAQLKALDQVRRAVENWQQACAAQASAVSRLEHTLRAQGFADVEEARATAMTPAERADLESLLQHRAFESREVDTVLSDPAVLEAAAEQPADVPALNRRVSELEEQRHHAIATQTMLARRADRLELLHSELDSTLAAWQPLRRAHHVATELAGMCAGTSVDNPHRIRLSSYVLAARLSQIVDAANDRLGLMTGGRYLLEHSDSRGVGDRRGGLGLRVRDGWTGESRDPATLSGGETFIASLALALGLADVVAYEAGGVELATLFVDEGFGSLDADTLDEVMDVLDDLRSGGRVVGLVSHVAELRSRISTRLQVTKSRQGSRLAQA
jgi:exonuclease SbcC